MTLDGIRLATGRPRSRFPLLALAVIGAALALGGCSTLFAEKDETFTAEPERPAAELYNEGLAKLRAGQLGAAAKSFEEVDRQHPYSEQARKALVMTAFVQYRKGDHEAAIIAAKRYLTLYPGTPDAAYAQYIMGQAYYRQMPVVTRDQEATRRAIAAMQEIVNNYPDSVYADDAREKLAVAQDQLAGKEMQIGRYYLERREYTAAINRFRGVVTEFPNTRHVEEALFRLTEAYLAMGLAGEAQTAAAVLGHNFPDSQWYKDAYARLETGGLKPEENRGSWMSRLFNKNKTG